MKLARVVFLILLPSVFFLAGCNNRNNATSTANPSWLASKTAWQDLVVGRSTRADVAAVFNTPVDEKDRYAYALDEGQWKNDTFLMMVDLDDDGIATAKYYWEWLSAPAFLAKLETWELAIDTRIPASLLQEYTANLGPREDDILQYFGRRLYEISAHFQDVNEVFGATGSMKRILTLAATQYSMRADKKALLSEQGFVFDGDVYGNKCTMTLTPVDERAGWYFLLLKGHRAKNFFTGW